MFNVKRNGASVEITEIPASIPFSVFKNIADETGANECLVAYAKGKGGYEVVIRHDSVNMAAAAEWLALESREQITGNADISTAGKEISPFDNIKQDFIVIGGFWREIARVSKLNYLAAKGMYENNEPLCEWNSERINKLTSKLMDAKTQNAVRITKNNWEFHL
ncbi:hypothetical protein ACV2HG_20005 [Salmonella enterica subsp. enterica serovar Pomona]|nr:hypothetical protein [Salmonella enterica]EMD4261826.1 hypothetical protein [Salmonella enterica]EMD4330511.1 hypothetical protein [Salmonella enterica]